MREVIHSERSPKAVGPYSQAIRAGKFVFTSGQLPIDPASGQIVDGGIISQTRQVLENLKAVLDAAGTDLSQVAKATVYLKNITDFATFNQEYTEHFAMEPPARSAFQVAALPMDALIEIDVVALVE